MTFMKKIFILIFLVAWSGMSAQGYKNKLDSVWTARQIKRGERMFDQMRYLKTSQLYAPIFQRGLLNDEEKSLLAKAYQHIASYKNSLDVWMAMDSVSMQSSDVYYMSQILKLNGLYKASDAWMARYMQMKTNDSRSKWQSNSAAEVEKIVSKERYDVRQVPFNSSQSDFGAFVNGNDLLFASARKIDEIVARQYGWKETPHLNVFKVTVSDEVYTQPQIYSPKLKTVYHDGPVHISADGNEMFVTQNPYKFPGKVGRKQINQFQLLVALKKSDGSWDELQKLPFNGDGFSTGHAALSPDGQTLWFASDRPGGIGRSDIYYVERLGSGWSEPVNAGSDINTEGDEMFPFLASDGNLYFSSNGHLTLGGLDVCVAFKTASGYKVRNMGHPINSQSDDFALCMMSDNRSGYFASNRPGGSGDDDIYRFDVRDPVVLTRQLEIRLIDKSSLSPVQNASVEIVIDGKPEVLKTDQTGLVLVTVDEVDQLVANVDVLGYKPLSQIFPIVSEFNKGEMLLEKMPVWGVYGTVTDLTSGLGIDSIQVVLRPLDKQQSFGNLTLNGGTFRNEIEGETDYEVTLSSPRYFSKKGRFTTKGRAPGWININEFMQATVEKIEVDKVIEIPNIYYDLGKWNIRKDAATELDKVVAFLTDNPAIIIELGSHTDSRGSALSNQTLSQKRAQSAVDYIVKKGIASPRISAKGYGESQLKNHCAEGVACSELEHQQNRRTEIRVVGVK